MGLRALIPGGIGDADVSLDLDCASIKSKLHGLLFAFKPMDGYSINSILMCHLKKILNIIMSIIHGEILLWSA